jgi:hypothetical protein
MREANRTLKQRVLHGVRQGLVIVFYLFIMLSVFDVYKSAVLDEHQLNFVEFGLNLISASALAKVILVGQELNLADQLRDAPLIYPTLLKSFVYTLLLACFKIVEVALVSMYRGRSLNEGVTAFAGGWRGLLSLTVVLFVVLIPFFGFGELRRVFGDEITQAFWRPRHLLKRRSV